MRPSADCLIQVPDISGEKLLQLTVDHLKLRGSVAPDLVNSDFMRGERGKTYRWNMIRPARTYRQPEKVAAAFPAGFTGSVAALLIWLTKNRAEPGPTGTILKGQRNLIVYYSNSRHPHALNFLGTRPDWYPWRDDWTFLAFSEIDS